MLCVDIGCWQIFWTSGCIGEEVYSSSIGGY